MEGHLWKTLWIMCKTLCLPADAFPGAGLGNEYGKNGGLSRAARPSKCRFPADPARAALDAGGAGLGQAAGDAGPVAGGEEVRAAAVSSSLVSCRRAE